MNAHDIPDAIQWHEGLLLTPQHFQQLSSRHEALVQYSTSLVAPFCWGIRRFKHDAISLTAGTFRVDELEGVMPDGLVISYGSDNAAGTNRLEVDLTKFVDQMVDKPVTIYVAVAARQTGNSNGDLSRYESFKGGLVPDETPGGKAHEIYRLKPRLNLVVSDSLPTKYSGFPLARVVHKDSSFALCEKFIPPLLTVPGPSTAGDVTAAAAQRLAAMCSKTAQRIRKRAMYVADEESGSAREGAASNEMATRGLMLSLVGCLPFFEGVLKIGVAHPLTVYLALCGWAGQLAVLGKDQVPPSFDSYDHNDLYATFKPVLEFIKRTVDQGVPLSYQSFPFRYDDDDGAFKLHFDGSWMNRRMAIGMKGPRGMSEAELIRWGESCLIGAQSEIASMREKRITGAVRTHADRVGDIVPGKGVVLFSLNADPNFIKSEEVLQIVNQTGPRPTEIVLHVRKKDG
jgi:type VI secretion system protein ImpJ